MKSINENGDMQINVRIKLAALWISLMLLFIYCDIYSFYRPDYINGVIAGMIGPFQVSQMILTIMGLLMIIPILMAPACMFFKSRTVKMLNITIGSLYSLVNISNLAGESWVYYWIYGLLELFFTISIIILSLKWSVESSKSSLSRTT